MFVKQDILDSATTGYALVKLDVSKPGNLMPSDLINLPTASKHLLKRGEFSEAGKRQFRKECLSMLVAIVSKLQERCLLKYLLVRTAACLSPLQLVREKQV